jgi:AcrR family transcriptional regulator
MPENRRDRHRRELRERIEAAALELFASHGYRSTTMDQIAEKADTSRRTLFNQFPRKRDILDTWSNRRREYLARMFDEDELSGLSARERLTRQFKALATINTDDPSLARVIVTGRYAEMEALEEAFPVFDALQESVVRGQQGREFTDRVSAKTIAEVLTACYFDTLQRWVITERLPADDLESDLRTKLDLVLDGVIRSSIS